VIVLDSNVLSETLRPKPASKVLDWLGSQPITAMFTTAVSAAELFYGVALLADGQRKRSLHSVVTQIFIDKLAGRVLPFDVAAAREYADIASTRHRAGRPISVADAQIAAVARSRGAALATRNVADFSLCGLDVIDTWL